LQHLTDLAGSIERGEGPEVYSVIPEGAQYETMVRTFEVLTGEKDFTLSRHHLLHYAPELGVKGYVHKDRRSLQYEVGIGVRTTPSSRLVLWPHAPRDENAAAHYSQYTAAKGGQAAIEAEVSQSQPVMLETRPGDVVFFLGSRMYHNRINPTNTFVYYLALNTYGLQDREASRQERRPRTKAG